jgi:ketosteroid isomerase-like protein
VSARTTLLTLASLVATAAATRDAVAQTAALTDSVAVVRTVDAFHDGLAAGDTTAVLRMLVPEALILEGGEIETQAEYAAHHLASDIAATQALKGGRTVRRVSITGAAAWVVSGSTMRGTFRGRERDLEGAELMVLERRDGVWRIASIHWSSHQRRKP